MSGQERLRRPSTGTGKPDESTDFETVVVPPVSDIDTALAKAMKQESAGGCGVAGCWCDACIFHDCEGHVDPCITAAQYAAGERRKVK